MVKTIDTSTNKIIYSKFITYLHRDDNVLSDFILITTNQSKTLRISEKHLIAKMSSNKKFEFVLAKNLNLNDVLVINDAENIIYEKIIKIENNVEETGVFAPLTESGTMLVDEILVSCYANTYKQDLAHFVFKFYIYAKELYELINDNIFNNKISENQNGIQWFADFLLNSVPYSDKFLI